MILTVIQSPQDYKFNDGKITIFLGGSIELGMARDWQSELIQWLENHEMAEKLVVLNPRRQQWDASWPTDDPNHAELRQQIEWELHMQDKADLVVYFFAGKTLSPITLLELGLYAAKKPVLCVEDGYLRAANVIVTAEHFGWDYNTHWDDFLSDLDARIHDTFKAH